MFYVYLNELTKQVTFSPEVSEELGVEIGRTVQFPHNANFLASVLLMRKGIVLGEMTVKVLPPSPQ